MRRSKAINLVKPDPTILSEGLTSIVQGVLSTEYQSKFRTSLVRNSLGVDVAPTYDSVDSYHKHLLAEMEALASGGINSISENAFVPNDAINQDEGVADCQSARRRWRANESNHAINLSYDKIGGGKGNKEGETPCQYFGKSQKGCTRGAKCPTKRGPTTPTAAARTTTATSPTTSPTMPTTPTARRAARIDETKNQTVEDRSEQPQTQPQTQPQAQPITASSGTPAELKEVLCEAKALTAAQAKSLRMNPLPKKMAYLENDEPEVGSEDLAPGAGLLDSGASHPLRVGSVGEMGELLHWTKNSLKLVHPRHGRLKVAVKGRCPELAVTDALRLIQELEEVELTNVARLGQGVCGERSKGDPLEDEFQAPLLGDGS